MKRLSSASFASSALMMLLLGRRSVAGTRPHYGGTLRISVRENVLSLDPAQSPNEITPGQAQAAGRIEKLLFDTLVGVDEHGRPVPGLAVSWQSDPHHQTWNLTLRRGVTFTDGSALSVQDVMNILVAANPTWKVRASGMTVTIETGASTPELPALLALPKNCIYRRGADGELMGTGAFVLDALEPGTRVALQANDSYWGGRTYLDGIEVAVNSNGHDQLISRRLDRDDALEVPLDQVTPLTQAGQRVRATQPADLYAIVFPQSGPARDARFREAIASTLDRASLNSVVLQKQGEATGAVLPQWMTGYAFLMSSKPDLERARKLRTEAAISQPLPFVYDLTDPLAHDVAERIAVNAREAGIVLQPYGEKFLSPSKLASTRAPLALLRIPLVSSDAAVVLSSLLPGQDIPDSMEELLTAERNALATFQIIPVAHVPEAVWLNPRVHDWAASPNGDWNLQDVWVEAGR